MPTPLSRVFTRSNVERASSVQRVTLRSETARHAGQAGLPGWYLLYGEAYGQMRHALDDAARWSDAASRQREALRRMRERRHTLESQPGNPDLLGITDTVHELEERWNSLGLLYFRCSTNLSSRIEDELSRLREHPAAITAGFKSQSEGPWQIDRVRLGRLLDERPDSVLNALFNSEGLLPCAEEILNNFLHQPARSMISRSLTLPYSQYNEYGQNEGGLPTQGWLLHESI
ncbi:hypothetical protein [Paenibacillus herberti]|uniref:Uncharacterized protein n=1 Tax=Paenibacillus herberti TaxID=1619309 RepID=A0A229P5I3_9BACL|nr:hypothetical protein [Paenibacillus herberti]OXM17378.1 hypothetical protein CGZ75_12480 [Paenibacillus herberti]